MASSYFKQKPYNFKVIQIATFNLAAIQFLMANCKTGVICFLLEPAEHQASQARTSA